MALCFQRIPYDAHLAVTHLWQCFDVTESGQTICLIYKIDLWTLFLGMICLRINTVHTVLVYLQKQSIYVYAIIANMIVLLTVLFASASASAFSDKETVLLSQMFLCPSYGFPRSRYPKVSCSNKCQTVRTGSSSNIYLLVFEVFTSRELEQEA